MPLERDFKFYQRRKHDKWRAVDPPMPALEAAVADSHAHVHMLPEYQRSIEYAMPQMIRSASDSAVIPGLLRCISPNKEPLITIAIHRG